MKKISIKDIAQQLDVSIALVSYVLNGKEKEARVGKEIALKIKQTAQQLNYQPNMIARTLKSGRSFTIGLIVADISNPFFSAIARIIEDEAQKYNYTVLFGSSDEKKEKSLNLINILSNRQVDGFIIAAAEHTEDQLQMLKKQHIPYVLIDRYFTGLDADAVRIDNYQAAFDAVTHLAKMGYKKIAMASYNTSLQHMQDRRKGYADSLKKNKLSLQPQLSGMIGFDSIETDMEKFITKLMKTPSKADAVFFATNMLAIAGIKQITASGLKVPEELGIITFDENVAFDFFYAPLTYVHQQPELIGKEAVKLLLENIDNPKKNRETVLINAPLIIRKSSTKKQI